MPVEAQTGATADAGSIPAASTFWLNRGVLLAGFGHHGRLESQHLVEFEE
jgi:hypothetical protein